MADKTQTLSTDQARGGETHDRKWLFVGLAAGFAVAIVFFLVMS
jgi:hypothetical protein